MPAPTLQPGALVWIRQRRWRIERVMSGRAVVQLDVSRGERRLTFLAPFDRAQPHGPPRRLRRVRPQSALARLAHLAAEDADARWPAAIVTADADVLPHQLEPALAVLAGHCRILIADDVGLGKTIQAGLLIAELSRRDPASRAVVLTPAFLRDQWIDELRQRFRIEARAADRHHIDAASRDLPIGENPWRQAGVVWVASVDFLKQRHVSAALPADPWDLVVIDEAHDVCGHSLRYSFVQTLTRRARRVVLLTATPHDGDAARFRRLVNIGRLDRETDDLVVFRRTRSVLGPRPARRIRWHRVAPSAAEALVLAALESFERAVLSRTDSDRSLLLLSVFRKRASSTMAALGRTIDRRLAWLDAAGDAAPGWSQPRLDFDDTDDSDLLADDEREGLMAPSGLRPSQERSRLRRLRTLTHAARDDRKIDRVVRLASRTRERLVVFSEFRDSVDALARRLRFSRPLSILHGGLDRAERATQLREFLNGSATLLLATDVAGQGLNLQHAARWVISLELPWNPARLEQRIGRVDRIGQVRGTHLTILTRDDHAESDVLRRLARRALSAERTFAGSLGAVAPPAPLIRQAIFRPTDDHTAETPDTPAICSRLRRPAERVARLLVARRRMAACSRFEEMPADSVFCNHPKAGRLLRAGSALVGFSIRFVTTSGSVVESRFVPIVVTFDAGTTPSPAALSGAARTALRKLIARRTRAIARRQLSTNSRLRAREMSIDAAAMADSASADDQPGLFDQRRVRSIEKQRSERLRLQEVLSTRIRCLEDETVVSVGELGPRIVIVRLA